MSLPGTHTPLIRVAAVTVTLESPKRLSSGDLRIGSRQYKLICDDGTLHGELNAVELSPDSQITLYYNTSSFQWKKTQKIDTRRLFESFSASQMQDLVVAQDGIQVKFRTTEGLTPTTQAILEDCPRFRILVIGKTGVGKSSLINAAFGISKARSADLMRGEANIHEGLESPVNKRFILHDSLGFEPGEKVNYETVKEFIRSKQTGELKDRLHAVWFCVQIPLAKGRLLEVAAEDFFRTKEKTMGAIPLIVVYTKFDPYVNQFASTASHGELDDESIMKEARSKAQSGVEEWHAKINQLAGESLPYEFVSTKKNYKYTLQNLVQLTHDQVGIPDTHDAQIASMVTLIAQRVVPRLKIQGSIDVGKRKYWKALRASPNFKGRTIWDCLSVIHTDIANVWNFNDPACHLLDKEFKELIVKMVHEMEKSPVTDPNRILAVGGSSLAAAAPALLAAVSNPAAPIVLPVIVGVAVVVWLYRVYQNVKNVQQIFMAFIVDLTHIMELLFILTSRDHNQLTRRAIKLAYKTYYHSGTRKHAHAMIQTYRDVDGRDAALEMIESLIRPGQSGGSNMADCYAKLDELIQDITKLNLDQEEDW